jgi:hypothetical protein
MSEGQGYIDIYKDGHLWMARLTFPDNSYIQNNYLTRASAIRSSYRALRKYQIRSRYHGG